MSKAAVVLALLGLALVAPGARAQGARQPQPTIVNLVLPTGERSTLAVQDGQLTVAIEEGHIRLSAQGVAIMRSAGPDTSQVEMINPTIIIKNGPPSAGSAETVQITADKMARRPVRR